MTEATQTGAEVSVNSEIAELLYPEEKPAAENPEVEATHEDADTVDEIDEDQPETDDPEGSESEEEAEEVTDEQDAVEEIEIDASALADYFGVDSDAFDTDDQGNLLIKTKIDGKEGKATLAELRKSYQLEGHVNQQNMQLVEDRKKFEAESQVAKQELQQTLQQAQSLLQVQEQNLMAEYQSIDWNALEQQDPGLFAATRQKMAERHAQIEQAKQFSNAQAAQMTAEQRQQILMKEGQALEAALPEWSDPDVKTKEQGELGQFLLNNGYKQEEVAQVADHRAVLLARKAMLYDKLITEQSTKAEVAKKKVIKKPKVLKPGASKSKQQQAAENQNAKLKLIDKTGGSRKAVAAYLTDLM